jgi:hypothetical protein
VSINQPTMRDRVARKLGVLPIGNSLSPEDSKLISDHMLVVQAKLEELDIAQVDVTDGIDSAIADIIVAMVASTLVDEFQLEEPKRSKIAGEGAIGLPVASVAERQLRKILAPTRVSRPVKVDFF